MELKDKIIKWNEDVACAVSAYQEAQLECNKKHKEKDDADTEEQTAMNAMTALEPFKTAYDAAKVVYDTAREKSLRATNDYILACGRRDNALAALNKLLEGDAENE